MLPGGLVHKGDDLRVYSGAAFQWISRETPGDKSPSVCCGGGQLTPVQVQWTICKALVARLFFFYCLVQQEQNRC